MGTVTQIYKAKFSVGELVHHCLFDYRGVIVDIDPVFRGSEEWYQSVAKSRPPKNQPWYHVLVHDAIHVTYVAERNLERDTSNNPVNHPLLANFFMGFENGRYISSGRKN